MAGMFVAGRGLDVVPSDVAAGLCALRDAAADDDRVIVGAGMWMWNTAVRAKDARQLASRVEGGAWGGDSDWGAELPG